MTIPDPPAPASPGPPRQVPCPRNEPARCRARGGGVHHPVRHPGPSLAPTALCRGRARDVTAVTYILLGPTMTTRVAGGGVNSRGRKRSDFFCMLACNVSIVGCPATSSSWMSCNVGCRCVQSWWRLPVPRSGLGRQRVWAWCSRWTLRRPEPAGACTSYWCRQADRSSIAYY